MLQHNAAETAPVVEEVAPVLQHDAPCGNDVKDTAAKGGVCAANISEAVATIPSVLKLKRATGRTTAPKKSNLKAA